MIKIGIKGKILKGDIMVNNRSAVGWNILIHDDANGETGGYYIYITHPTQDGWGYAFDYWLENKSDVTDFFRELNLKIEWSR